MEEGQERQSKFRVWHFILVLIFGVILSMGIWGNINHTLVGDDYMFHVARMQGTSHALSNGQIIAQVDPDAMNGFGYAYNLFYGPLVTYVASGIQFLVQNWTVAINLVLIMILIMSGMTMCYALTKISKSPALGAMAAIFYMAAPYLLTDLYDRMAIGESMAFIAAPILLLGLYQLIVNERNVARSLAIVAALLIVSHSLSAMIFALMGGVYVLLNIDKVLSVKKIWRMILAVIVALGLTAVFTLPLIEVKVRGANYGIFDTDYVDGFFGSNADGLNAHRLWPDGLILSKKGDGLYLSLGFVAIFALAGFWLIRTRIENKLERRFVTSLYVIAILAILATTTLIDWNYMPSIMLQMQFPWRFLEIVTVALSVVAAYVGYVILRGLAEDKQKVLVVFAGVLAIIPVMNFYLPSEQKVLEEELSAQEEIEAGSLGWQVEYAPKQMLCSVDNPDEKDQDYKCSLNKINNILAKRGKKVRVLDGTAKLGSVRRDGGKFEIEVKKAGQEQSEIELPLVYYPGYEAWINDEELKVEPSENLGLVMVVIPAQTEGTVTVSYGISTATYVGAVITSVTVGVGLVWLIITGWLDVREKKKNTEVAKLMETVREAIGDDELLGFDDIKHNGNVVELDKKATRNTKTVGKDTAPKQQKKAAKTSAKTSTKKTSATKSKAQSAKSAKTKSKASKDDSKITRVKASSRPRKDPE